MSILTAIIGPVAGLAKNYLSNKAEEKQAKIVDNTIAKIVELKTEINELKQELNNINSDTTTKFKLFPISDN